MVKRRKLVGTIAAIVVKKNDTFLGMRVRYDGDLAHAGKLLHDFYNTEEKAFDLVKKGNTDVLSSNINLVVFDGDDPIESDSISMLNTMLDGKYVYIFCNGSWLYIDIAKHLSQPLDAALQTKE
jgi:hypothetical protein